MEKGKEITEQLYEQRLMAAERLTRDAYFIVDEKLGDNEQVAEGLRWSYRRTAMETFYRRPISSNLISLDAHGHYRESVRTFETLFRPETAGLYETALINKTLKDPLNTVVHRKHVSVIFLGEALRRATLSNGTALNWERVLDSRDLGDFVAFLREHRTQFENLFGSELRSDLAEKPVAQLNTLLGRISLKLKKRSPLVDHGKKIYRYGWDQMEVDEMMGVIDQRENIPDKWEWIESLKT